MNNPYEAKQMQLLKENQLLRLELREARILIKSLRQENIVLQEKLSYYENQQSTFNHFSNASSEEIFTESNSSENDQLLEDADSTDRQYNSVDLIQRVEIEELPPLALTKVGKGGLKKASKTPHSMVYNFHEQKEMREEKIVDKRKERIFSSSKNFEQSQKNDENSAIKNQESILFKSPNQTIFHKLKTSKPIFNTFFVTGFSESNLKSHIAYCFPKPSQHFPALLSLLYAEPRIKQYQGSNGMNRSPKANMAKTAKYIIKETFVIPIGKQSARGEEKQYVIACEVDDYLQVNERNFYVYSRYFCFISSCKFFSVFEKVITQLIDKVNMIGRPHPIQFEEVMKEELEEPLKILSSKSAEENQYLNFSLGNQINVFIDVPPLEESYKNLLQFNYKNILSMKVQFLNSFDGLLLGFLLVYLLSEVKIILYSLSKAKISQCILNILEIIKPLEYVNPIIMAALKDEHEEYLGAPMSLILGLWGQPKRGRQKIEIFMNKKQNLCGLIEKGKLQIDDGIVINLDTGYIFGGGISPLYNEIGSELNEVLDGKSAKQRYKFIDKLVKGQIESKKVMGIGEKLKRCMENTQLLSYYRESKNILSLVQN